MTDVIINDEHLHDIADAIRSKNGSEDIYKPKEMAAAIDAIEGRDPDCNGMHVPEEALVISGNCSYRDYYGKWDWFIEQCGDKITTENLLTTNMMFGYAKELEEIPFDFNFDNQSWYSYNDMFFQCNNLKSIGRLVNMYPSSIESIFENCNNLRYLPEFENLNMNRMQTYANSNMSKMFNRCYSLRSIPESLLKELHGIQSASYYAFFYDGISYCYSLDEIKGINPNTGEIKTNMFTVGLQYCGRLKEYTFLTEDDGTPYTVKWANQNLDLSKVGAAFNKYQADMYICGYNSGITSDKAVYDDESYQRLKNDPDWYSYGFSTDVDTCPYSRYNHDSAVNTINSLPDTSAYLASVGGTNTIKFGGENGSATDGGAINTLTPEEIAIATQKGWTVAIS